MGEGVFTLPRGHRLGFILTDAMFIVAFAAAIPFSALYGGPLLVMLFVVLMAFVVSPLTWLLIHSAYRVTLSDDYLFVETMIGKKIKLLWRDIDEVQEFVTPIIADKMKKMRIISRRGRVQVVLLDRLVCFDEIVQDVRMKIPQTFLGRKPKILERAFLTG